MAILVLSSPLPAQPFIDALRALAPGVPVWSEADDPPADRVEALLAWRLKPGTVPRYPRLRVLCSVGAGAEKLLVDDLPDHVTVTRVVDPLHAARRRAREHRDGGAAMPGRAAAGARRPAAAARDRPPRRLLRKTP